MRDHHRGKHPLYSRDHSERLHLAVRVRTAGREIGLPPELEDTVVGTVVRDLLKAHPETHMIPDAVIVAAINRVATQMREAEMRDT